MPQRNKKKKKKDDYNFPLARNRSAFGKVEGVKG